jgi:hypothetical protein
MHISGTLEIMGVAARKFTALKQINREHGQNVKAFKKWATRTKGVLGQASSVRLKCT